jgi:molybdopterin/thiamine biosynthesis adenylyltransferase
VIDATTVRAKFLIADLCHAAGRPVVHGGIRAFEGWR